MLLEVNLEKHPGTGILLQTILVQNFPMRKNVLRING
jgi:hypothetical protein